MGEVRPTSGSKPSKCYDAREWYKQARQMLTNAARGVHIDGTAKVVQHQEIEPITASEHEHCFEDRPHPVHTIKKMTIIVHGG